MLQALGRQKQYNWSEIVGEHTLLPVSCPFSDTTVNKVKFTIDNF